jgi:hypothetical protein
VQPTSSSLNGNLLDNLAQIRFNRFTFGTNRFQNFALPSAVRSSTAGRNNKVLARAQSATNAADQGIVLDNGQYTFLPFSFSGALASLSGDNIDATLEIANTRISRDFAVRYLDRGYIAKVRTVLWSSEPKIPFAPGSIYVEKSLCEYVGVCSSGGWNDRKLQIKLNSVLDAVQSNVPGRRLRREQVGNLPHTAQVAI